MIPVSTKKPDGFPSGLIDEIVKVDLLLPEAVKHLGVGRIGSDEIVN